MLERLKKRWFLIGLVLAGLLAYVLRDQARHFPRHLSICLLFATMAFVGLSAQLNVLLKSMLNWRASVLSLAGTYIMAPIVAYLVGWAFFSRGTELFQGCVLVGCTASTVSSAIIYTRLAGGNHELSIVLSNLSNTISVLLTPLMIGAALATTIDIDIQRMILKLAIGVLAPILFAQAIAHLFPKPVQAFRPKASLFSQLGILLIVFTAICKTFHLADTNPQLGFYQQLPKAGLKMVLASFIMVNLLMRLSYRISRWAGLPPRDAVSVSYASSQKTLAATVVLAQEFFTPAASLPMIIYHLVQLLYGGYDSDRMKQVQERESNEVSSAIPARGAIE